MLDALGWQPLSQRRQLIVVYTIINGLEQERPYFMGDVFWSYTNDGNCHHQFIVCFFNDRIHPS